MTTTLWRRLVALFALLAVGVSAYANQTIPLTSQLVASGFNRPTLATSPPADFTRIFVLEQNTGLIRIIKSGSVVPTPFLDLSAKITPGGERGLLGLAFHPDYRTNQRFFVFYNNTDGDTTLEEYLASATDLDTALPNTGQVLLTLSQPFPQHNGGSLAFGPNDGMLYVSTGDGGSGNDPMNNAQDLSSLLGKILRIDVDGAAPYEVPPDNPFVGVGGAAPEIWAYGLRNPWRTSFDRATGDYYIGDVGQEGQEEVDVIPDGVGGLNFGWRCVEGLVCTTNGGCVCPDPGFTDPLLDYDHNEGCSVTGGYVYRGNGVPGLAGTYFYGDYCTGRVWSFRPVGGQVTELCERTTELTPAGGSLSFLSSFGEDARGELYIVGHLTGDIYKIVAAPPVPDCDGDGTSDADEIAQGLAFDVNGNDVPDDCELLLTVGPVVLGGDTPMEVIGATPGQVLAFFWGWRGIGAGPCLFQGTLCLDITQPLFLLGILNADAQGSLAFDLPIPTDLGPLNKLIFQVVYAAGLGSQKSNPVQKIVQP